MKPHKKMLLGILVCIISYSLPAQETPNNWHLLDLKKDKVVGISLKQAYELLEKNKKTSQATIVAVLDSGVDIAHEDLQSIIWTNEKEIADNSTDDDGNGYVDDIHGWNFIGNSKGESLIAETLELTRLYRKYKIKFGDKDKFSITKGEKQEYLYYLQLKKEYEDASSKINKSLSATKEEYAFFQQLIPPLQKTLEKEIFTSGELNDFKSEDEQLERLKKRFLGILDKNPGLTSEKLIKHYQDTKRRQEEIALRVSRNYNLEFDGRKLIGDQNDNLSEKGYGNPDVSKRSEHGTHVSGIIGAVRGNNLGVDGIADHVVIMPIRSTPMGDEADKDVANGIRYAVDNGARIINMSFGKDYSPNKQTVDEAVRYAKKKGVLLVHGAGNDNTNTDLYYNYPSALLEDGTVASNWIEVGASSAFADENLAADFSNYGMKSVDIFAPGVDIYSTLPKNKYDTRSGTSMAAPVVTGVSALLLSYFPELTPEEIKEIILDSGVMHDISVKKPGSDEKASFKELSKTGKIVNAYEAVKLALEKYTSVKSN